MKANATRVSLIRAHLSLHPEHGWRQVSRATGIPHSSTANIIKSLRDGTLESTSEDVGGKVVEVQRSTTIRTLAALLKEGKVDEKVWEVTNHIINKHDMLYKDSDDNGKVQELYQVKAWLRRRPGPPDSEIISDALAIFHAKGKKVKKLKPVTKTGNLLEISIPDLHYGALSWSQETGEDYDSQEAERRFMGAVDDLLTKGKVFGFDKVLFPVGSDFFHTDNADNSTAAGTRLDVDTRWQRSFIHGCKLIRRAIDQIRTHAPVEIIVISGNHDESRAFYMGEVLSAVYASAPDVSVNNSPKPRKYFVWGTVLLGLTHGHKLKVAALPNLMAGEAAQEWAKTTHREWHVGHLHHAREDRFHAGMEQNATRIRVLPSLCGTDAWHSANGFVGAKKAAEAYLWNLKDGYVGHFSFSPR